MITESASRPPYRIEVWCIDCTGQDPQGCFDGGVDTHGPFATYTEAAAVGSKVCDDTIWRFNIYDATGSEVE